MRTPAPGKGFAFVPNVQCPSCGLSSYVAPPHSVQPLCPHCDADLLVVVTRPPVRPDRTQEPHPRAA